MKRSLVAVGEEKYFKEVVRRDPSGNSLGEDDQSSTERSQYLSKDVAWNHAPREASEDGKALETRCERQ
jgi:hypothetical protein